MATRFGAAFWVQRTGWPELREAVERAEAAGFDDLWIDDHVLNDEGDPRAPKLEGWTTLAAVAGVTRAARLGLLVGANTLRNPGLTAKLATTLDHQSGGRAILGLGAGWFEREHEAFGFDFGAGFGERIDRLTESVGLVRRLLDGERVTEDGGYYRLRDAVCTPRPLQAHLPILVGGSGPRKTLPLVARSADLWNAYGTPEDLGAADATLRTACDAIGRDPATIERTTNLTLVIRDDPVAAEAVWAEVCAIHEPQPGEDRADVLGTAGDAVRAVRAYAAVGFDHLILIFRTPWDLETISRLPELRARLAGG